MSKSEQERKYALECLRLESACMQLAADAPSPVLQSHFVRMARAWLTLAGSRPSADPGREPSASGLSAS